MTSFRVRFDIPAAAVQGIDRAARRQLGPVVRQVGERIVETAQDMMADELENDRPESRRNASRGRGHMIESFRVGAPDLSGGRVRVVLLNTSPAFKFIEKGTPEHEITGRLAFPRATTSQGGGQYAVHGIPFIVTDSVNHPGNRAYKFLERATEEHKHDIDQIKVLVRLHLGG
jgi:hypothetical protein